MAVAPDQLLTGVMSQSSVSCH